MDHITLLVKFNALLLLILSSSVSARQQFEFDFGKKINILSDKAYRKTSENEFEAVGNVVITHLKNAIYGERAKVNFNTGDVEVVGNVRYIAPELTLYGTKLSYNLNTRKVLINNARVQSDNYVITGKEILRPDEKNIKAQEAEYTTCRDCPESWSIYARHIDIDIGEYIYLKHAFVKVKGVTVLYFPYLVLPIKQKRQSGLLFPEFSFTSDEGFRFQQPFFWAIDDYKDMTITPSNFGDRGLGGELQYRQSIAPKTWIELNSIAMRDKIYEPYKVENTLNHNKKNRYYGEFEGHYSKGHSWNGHFLLNNASDLDTIRDFDFYTDDRLTGTELGGGGFLERRFDLFNITTESYFNNNLLYNDPREFDHQYVQMLPKISLKTVPYNMYQSEVFMFKNISFGLESDFTVFKQNHYDNTGDIRNARRLNFVPYMDWQLGNLGPFAFSHQMKFDYQSYRFSNEEDKDFHKLSTIHESEVRFEVEKIYGLAYIEEVPRKIENNLQKTTSIIGELPAVNVKNSEENEYVFNNSYRHVQEFRFKHYYLGKQSWKGNKNFYDQIQRDDGQFDYVDSIRGKEYLINQNTSYDSLPIANTIEVRWSNNLIRKKAKRFNPFENFRYLKDNFDYKNIAYFDISQGVDLNNDSNSFSDKLTRLYLNTGINLDKFGINFEEFYYHQQKEHKFNTTFNVYLENFTLGAEFTYNSFNSVNTPVSKLVGYHFIYNLNDFLLFKNSVDYNLKTSQVQESFYSVTYSPENNCWKTEISYSKDLIESKVGVLLHIYYNDNNFASINLQ